MHRQVKRKIAILGSTGSIGTQTLDVVRQHRDMFEVEMISANNNAELLIRQAVEFDVNNVVICNGRKYGEVAEALQPKGIKVFTGADSLCSLVAGGNIDIVVGAMVGFSGLRPTLAALEAGKIVALANKETLVVAGSIVTATMRKHDAVILPVDSEHSAIFQSMAGGKRSEVKRILLTASGGPFRGKKYDEIKNATKEAALKHPNWSMGQKITIDSASMMNKGLEFIEAMHLFGVRPDQIEVLVHPQSIVHSAVEFSDNSVIAQFGVADMRIPIQYALTYPDRMPSPAKSLDLTALSALTFEKPDTDTFKSLKLAMDTAGRKDAACAVMNGANEAAVALFLQDKIAFGEMYECVSLAVEELGGMKADTIDDVLLADEAARKFVFERYS